MTPDIVSGLYSVAQQLIDAATRAGQVIEIRQKPAYPLAMGNNIYDITIRPVFTRPPVTIEMVAVSSTNVASVGWLDRTLRVVFTNGGAYDYAYVPREIFEALLAAESPGKFLNQNIKGKYPFQAVEL